MVEVMESSVARLKYLMTAVQRFVGGAQLTYVWLTVLLITTFIQHQLTHQELRTVLVKASTNLRHLGADPLYVLVDSLFWIDGRYWWPYLVLFTLFLAPAEHWLGKIRWLAVGLTAHVVATILSEGVLYWQIQHHLVPGRLVHARDIGVSYFLVGVVAVLAYRFVPPWRWGYLAVLILGFAVAWYVQPSFTAIGHFSAIFIGLCFYPMARRRPAPLWDPARLRVLFSGSHTRGHAPTGVGRNPQPSR
jgi:hypothetical protein